MTFMDKLAIISGSKRTYHFACVLTTGKQIPDTLRQVSTLPHRESDGYFLLVGIEKLCW